MKLSPQDGFSLVELLIAVAISGVILTGIVFAYMTQQSIYNTQGAISVMQQNLRGATLIMADEIRKAGYNASGQCNNPGFITATANGMSFNYCADEDGLDNNSNAQIDEPGEVRQVTFDLYDAYGDGLLDIGMQVGTTAATKRALADNIQTIEFFYTMQDGTTTLNPVTLADIRSVQVSILARSDRDVDIGFSNTSIYTTASGAIWGPYNDNIRRRFIVVNIKCRNMGL